MRVILKTSFIAIFVLIASYPVEAYDREAAVNYAKDWTTPPPPVGTGQGFWNNKYNFYGKSDNDGSDCANFVSQALIAGCYSQAFINPALSDSAGEALGPALGQAQPFWF